MSATYNAGRFEASSAAEAIEKARERYRDSSLGRTLRVWMQERGFDLADVARETGYAAGTVECWCTGWALSRRAMQRLAAIGFAPEAR